MNKKNIKNILLCLFGLSLVIVSLILYVKSKSDSGSYTYPTASGDKTFHERDFKFNYDYVVSMLVGFAILAYGLYVTYMSNKNLEIESKYYFLASGSASLLVSFYGFARFIEAFVDAKADKYKFKFFDNQIPFYIGVVAGFYFAYIVSAYLASKENK